MRAGGLLRRGGVTALTVVACGGAAGSASDSRSASPDADSPGAPNTSGLPASAIDPIAGAVVVGPSSGTLAQIVIDSADDGTLLWDDTAGVMGSRYVGGRWSTPAVLDAAQPDLSTVQLGIDLDGNVTGQWAHEAAGNSTVQMARVPVGSTGWTGVQSVGAGRIVPGGHGQLALVGVAATSAQPCSEQLMASLYDQGNWGTATVLASATPGGPSPGECGAAPTPGPCAFTSDGALFVTWTATTTSSSNYSTQQAIFSHYEAGSGWAAATPTGLPVGTAWLLTDGSGGATLLGVEGGEGDAGDWTQLASEQFVTGVWTSPVTSSVRSGVGSGEAFEAAAMGQGGSAMVMGADARVSAVYFTASAGWSNVDVPDTGLDAAGSAPFVGVDAHGRAVALWNEGVHEDVGNVIRVFYARYDPVSGWTAPVQIDGGGGRRRRHGGRPRGQRRGGRTRRVGQRRRRPLGSAAAVRGDWRRAGGRLRGAELTRGCPV